MRTAARLKSVATVGIMKHWADPTSVVFAATLKLLIPFLVVIPGILAFNLFSGDLHISAATKNVAIVQAAELDHSSGVISVEAGMVALQPELAARALAHNSAVLGAEAKHVTDVEDDALANRINELAQTGVDSGQKLSTLKAYDYDSAFPVLVRNLIKPIPMISWFVLAALCGAVISSLASMLNSASTIATMDLYAKFTGEKNPAKLVKVGRGFVVLFVLMAAFVAPKLDNFESIFAYIQEFQGFISPGILAVFIFGFFSPRTPRYFGAVGIGLNVFSYGAFKWYLGDLLAKNGWWYADQIAFLDRMAICFFIVMLAGIILTIIKPMKAPVVLPENKEIELESSKGAQIVGIGVVIATIALYAVFW